MDYGELIGGAFRIAWRNRYLWFFGFIVSGGAGSPQISIPPNPEGTGGLPIWLIELGQWVRQNVALAVALGVGLFLLLLLISAAGLADTVAALQGGERRSFVRTWRTGVRNLRRMFLFFVLLFSIGLMPIVLIGGLVALGIFGIVSAANSEMLQVVFVTLIVPAALALLLVVYIPLYLVQQLALRELVIGGKGVMASVRGGYRILRRNPGRTVAVWLVQFVIALGVMVVMFVIGTVIGLAQTFGFLALSYSAPYPLLLAAALVTGLIVSLPLIVVAALIGVYNHAYWTLAYLRLVALPTVPFPTTEQDGQTND